MVSLFYNSGPLFVTVTLPSTQRSSFFLFFKVADILKDTNDLFVTNSFFFFW